LAAKTNSAVPPRILPTGTGIVKPIIASRPRPRSSARSLATACAHLDAEMVARGLGQLRPHPGAAVPIENVGESGVPALFDLGEHAKW
jgi:Ni2+-binding GTPase involved in maturation of urease and hydrogenase